MNLQKRLQVEFEFLGEEQISGNTALKIVNDIFKEAETEQLLIPLVSQQRELLICVDKGNWGCLTEQKEYELLASHEDIYMLKDDDGAINNYDARYFKKVKAN